VRHTEPAIPLESLRILIKEKLVGGRLPIRITHVWGGPGNCEICLVCDLPISKDEFVMEGMDEHRTAVQFHVECFYLWEAECHAGGVVGSSIAGLGDVVRQSSRSDTGLVIGIMPGPPERILVRWRNGSHFEEATNLIVVQQQGA
jgi:hypothetical protein